MRVISIDPGYERVGFALLEREPDGPKKETLIFSECFKTSALKKPEERLGLIGKELASLIEKYKPEALAIETLFFETNTKTAMRVAEARGVLLYEAAIKKIQVTEFTPLQIKVAVTGYGKSNKNQVMDMVKRLIKITKPIKHDDEYDAIAIGLTFFACYRE